MLRNFYIRFLGFGKQDVHGLRYYVAMLVAYGYLVSYGFGPYIVDEHSFRQCQTALSSYYLESFWQIFSYITPVLGSPWTIPFEFPIYQGLVKLLSVSTGIALELAGRIVSVSFFLLCLWPLSRILNWLRIENKATVLLPTWPIIVYI